MKSFWQTLEGKITAVTTAVLLLAAFFGAFQKLWDSVRPLITSLWSPPEQQAVTVVVKYPKVIPLSLMNTINLVGRPDWLYWVYLEADNKSKEKTAHIEVTFFVLRGPATPLEKPLLYEVGPHRSLTTWPNPTKDLSNLDQWQSLGVEWKATISGQTGFNQGTTDPPIELLPRNVIAWDLRTPEGKQVPPEFLLAWLRAWVVTAATQTQDDAQLRQSKVKLIDAPIANRARGWMEACYNRLFAGSARIVVDPQSQQLPGHGRQTIRTATSLLQDRYAGPLEAALLMAGASRKFLPGDRVDLALFGLPSGQNAGSDRILLLGWRPPGDAWHAIEITRASQLAFAANEQQATARLNAVLSAEKPLLEKLDKEGWYAPAESSIVALDLVNEDKPYRIYGLP